MHKAGQAEALLLMMQAAPASHVSLLPSPGILPMCLERRESNGQYRDHHGKLRPRTFTSRPSHGLARTQHRSDFTHNPARLVDIATETKSLVTRLEHVYSRPVGPAIANKSPPRGKPCNEAPTSRNRLAALHNGPCLLCLAVMPGFGLDLLRPCKYSMF